MMTPNIAADTDLQSELQQRSTIDLLQAWIDGEDSEDQKETGDCLIETLDSDRSSLRQLFPPELEGVTW
jgi:hypothetical protein